MRIADCDRQVARSPAAQSELGNPRGLTAREPFGGPTLARLGERGHAIDGELARATRIATAEEQS